MVVDILDILQYEHMRNALISALLASIACGIIGTYVVVKRIVFISGGIAHASFGGIGMGYYLGINPVLGILPFGIASALGIGWITKRSSLPEDSAIGIFWASGMAIGVIFLNLTPGYAPDLMTYLFGNILTVPFFDVIVMLILDIIIASLVYLFYKEFLALSFDEEMTAVLGVPAEKLYFLLLCLIALTVMVLVRVVGIILVIALLTIPAALSRQITSDFKRMIFLSVIFGGIFSTGGIGISYMFDIPSGATIILVMSIFYFAYSLFRGKLNNLLS
ncbi:MAG: metal ABC transporter permease [Methanohalobium sp.]|uniref:metal ABC transporter permease n=1 Tax=Methanohalobium sp. TaxID=2837493 RepID=UPI00397916B7